MHGGDGGAQAGVIPVGIVPQGAAQRPDKLTPQLGRWAEGDQRRTGIQKLCLPAPQASGGSGTVAPVGGRSLCRLFCREVSRHRLQPTLRRL
jgi:hypothetical protein